MRGRLQIVTRVALCAALMLLIALIGAADYWTGTEIDCSVFYLIPIALAAWFVGPRMGFAAAFFSALTWLSADLYGGYAYSNRTIPYWNALAGLAFFLIIAATLAARRRALQRILELMRVKSEFTSMVSHELRTPLTCIKEGIDIVADESSGPLNARQKEHLLTAKRNVDRLARLLNDVLTYQKLEARRMELSSEPCDINRLAAQALEAFALLARKKRLQLSAELAPSLPLVHCDRDKICQVLSNLLSNALKFSDQGRICVRSEACPGGVRISVQDQGVGIPPEAFVKLFQGFSQLPSPASRRTDGTGLGLAIARQIVELHGGELRADSRPGAGSTFYFTLPLGAPHPSLRGPAPVSAAKST